MNSTNAEDSSASNETDHSQPINFESIMESVELALRAHDDVPDEIVPDITHTVEEACANNARHLMWRPDYDDFMDQLDELLDGVYGNGYDEQIRQLDDLRTRLNPINDNGNEYPNS